MTSGGVWSLEESDKCMYIQCTPEGVWDMSLRRWY
jgi:hypothetical protein